MTERPALWIVVCAAGPAPHVGRLVTEAQQRSWRPFLIATPSATGFIDMNALETLTGAPVRSGHRRTGERASGARPRADAIIVAPATYNTINKWANGVADNYALDVLAEAVGYGIPIAVLPFVNANLAERAPFRRSVAALRAEGVDVMLGREWQPHPPGTGADRLGEFPWARGLDRIEQARSDV